MIVLVVFNRLCNRLDAEAERSFKLEYELIIDSPPHVVIVVCLIFRLVQLVPWVVFEALDVYTLLRVCLENFRYYVFGLRR